MTKLSGITIPKARVAFERYDLVWYRFRAYRAAWLLVFNGSRVLTWGTGSWRGFERQFEALQVAYEIGFPRLGFPSEGWDSEVPARFRCGPESGRWLEVEVMQERGLHPGIALGDWTGKHEEDTE